MNNDTFISSSVSSNINNIGLTARIRDIHIEEEPTGEYLACITDRYADGQATCQSQVFVRMPSLMVEESGGEVEKEEHNMSFAISLRKNNDLYIAADSRNTITLNSIDGSNHNSYYTDDYQKIVISPNNKYFIFSTGNNIFNGFTLKDTICNIGKNLQQIRDHINTSRYCIFEIKEDKFFYTTNDGQNEYPDNFMYFSGDNGAVEIVRKIPAPTSFVERDIISFLNSIFHIVTEYSNLTQKTIGGAIHILKISLDGSYKWVQNPYNS